MTLLSETSRLAAFLLAFPFVLSACSSGDSSSTQTSDDQTTPTVSSVSPGDSATGVARGTDVIATFSEDLFTKTIGSNTVTVTDGSVSVAGKVNFDPTNNEVSFLPDNTLSMLTTYTTTLSTDITDLAGNALGSAHTWSFTTADGTWKVPTLIETDNAGDARDPQIAIDAEGNALAIWAQIDVTGSNTYANRYTAGLGWGAATLIETNNAGRVGAPQIAFDAEGNAVAVWYQADGIRFNIYSNRYTTGSGWGTATLIETEDAGDAIHPQVAVDTSGNVLAVWEQSDGNQFSIYANRYTPGSGWGSTTLIETDNAGNARSPQIAFDASGNALAVWKQTDGSGARFNIHANRYTAGSGWGTATLIQIDNSGNADYPQIAVDAEGNALAVWSQLDDTRYNIHANRYTPGSGWGSATLIQIDNASNAYIPQVVFDTSGYALAVWEQYDDSQFNIHANRYTPGSGWGTATLIETDNLGSARSPQIAFDSSGNAMAVWYQSDGTRHNILANRYTASSGWGAATLVETDNAGRSIDPQVAFDASGNALVVWRHSDGIRDNIMANRFE
ncbi:Ig-like domain-containing protein [Saccharospirillum impatiens]|uniref:Ig-like domain-containing protein n=1 Tax=Saccharospirillum impatiens TaxID=169438 RepID=UPI00041CEB99|nr:Ig-like domain-containing protein [Saccharospirillum impatiens]